MDRELDTKVNIDTLYKPPSKYGLSNSDPIIPSYYIQKFKSILFDKEIEHEYIKIDYLTIIKDDIRNCRKLNIYQIDYIKNYCNNETKNDIIDELLNANNSLIDILIDNE